jgi:hypothetical protein
MTRRMKIWLAISVVFVLVNVAGMWMAARAEEGMHTTIHVLLTLAGVIAVRALLSRRVAQY